MWPNWQKMQVLYETKHGELNFRVNIFVPEVHVWPVKRVRSREVAKIDESKTWSICQNFTSNRKLVTYIFANKVNAISSTKAG